ncbi:unnamed protein product [Coffea canephora]|uniref:Uncharacterized protein n=1 Tax=Coffea canephora TaxID=49390 RepID=A0A068UU63_COFCA|nr:unnamed protein product [Coffea canephora]
MRFLSELGSCWGVAPVTPAAETTPSALTSRKQEEVVGGGLGQGGNSSHAAVMAPADSLRRVKSASRHWKPSLHMISEDSVLVSDKGRTSRVGSDDKKSSAKVKANSRCKAAKPTYHGEDYWKSSSLWAIPAFAPSPF